MFLSDFKNENDLGDCGLFVLKTGEILELKVGFLDMKQSAEDDEADFMVSVAEKSMREREVGKCDLEKWAALNGLWR